MVAPIVEKMDLTFQSAKVDVWFPEGEWYDFFSEKKYTGGVKLSIYRDVSNIPVFAKSGAIIPLVGSEIGMGVDLPEVVDWYVFPGNNILLKCLKIKMVKDIKQDYQSIGKWEW